MGDDWNQQKISLLEQKETVEPALLQEVARILKFPVELFSTFNEDQPVNIVRNTFTDSFNDSKNAFASYNNCTFNPLDKMVELYERMLRQQKEMIEKLEKLIEKK
ncbi:DUF677 domain-containing protein [Gynurincola endophyticus]|uniref:DUF677 domain-containing protein n=1 Tax=Gynurincola endophyticus TaxID=2479004 RepID=UPI001F175B76|nr:DUF677 domain-containing protein [Gynurincola endophyticus]